MNLGARSYGLFEGFNDAVRAEIPSFLSDEYKKKLDVLVQETCGVDLANFMNGHVFKGQITGAFSAPLAKHSEGLTLATDSLVRNAIAKLAEKHSVGLPKLQRHLLEAVDAMLDERVAQLGKTVQVEPMERVLKASGTKCLKLKCD